MFRLITRYIMVNPFSTETRFFLRPAVRLIRRYPVLVQILGGK